MPGVPGLQHLAGFASTFLRTSPSYLSEPGVESQPQDCIAVKLALGVASWLRLRWLLLHARTCSQCASVRGRACGPRLAPRLLLLAHARHPLQTLTLGRQAFSPTPPPPPPQAEFVISGPSSLRTLSAGDPPACLTGGSGPWALPWGQAGVRLWPRRLPLPSRPLFSPPKGLAVGPVPVSGSASGGASVPLHFPPVRVSCGCADEVGFSHR